MLFSKKLWATAMFLSLCLIGSFGMEKQDGIGGFDASGGVIDLTGVVTSDDDSTNSAHGGTRLASSSQNNIQIKTEPLNNVDASKNNGDERNLDQTRKMPSKAGGHFKRGGTDGEETSENGDQVETPAMPPSKRPSMRRAGKPKIDENEGGDTDDSDDSSSHRGTNRNKKTKYKNSRNEGNRGESDSDGNENTNDYWKTKTGWENDLPPNQHKGKDGYHYQEHAKHQRRFREYFDRQLYVDYLNSLPNLPEKGDDDDDDDEPKDHYDPFLPPPIFCHTHQADESEQTLPSMPYVPEGYFSSPKKACVVIRIFLYMIKYRTVDPRFIGTPLEIGKLNVGKGCGAVKIMTLLCHFYADENWTFTRATTNNTQFRKCRDDGRTEINRLDSLGVAGTNLSPGELSTLQNLMLWAERYNEMQRYMLEVIKQLKKPKWDPKEVMDEMDKMDVAQTMNHLTKKIKAGIYSLDGVANQAEGDWEMAKIKARGKMFFIDAMCYAAISRKLRNEVISSRTLFSTSDEQKNLIKDTAVTVDNLAARCGFENENFQD